MQFDEAVDPHRHSRHGDMLAVGVAVGKTSEEQALHTAVVGNLSLKLLKPVRSSGPSGGTRFAHAGL